MADKFGIQHVVGVFEANWLLVHHLPADAHESVLLTLAFAELVLFLAEALHDAGEMGLFSCHLRFVVNLEFRDGVKLES